MKKTNLNWKFLFPMVLMFLLSNTAFSQKVNVSSISDGKLSFVITSDKDVANEIPEKVFGPNFITYLDEDFDVEKLIMYPTWGFSSMTVSSKGAKEGEVILKKFFAIYNKESGKYLRWSKKDLKLKLVDKADYDVIWKKKEGTMDYVQPFDVRMSFYFDLKPTGDYVKIYRFRNATSSYNINTKLSKGNIKLILVDR